MPLHRYKFESNSQRLRIQSNVNQMFMPLHRYKFESNSQRINGDAVTLEGCLCHYIDTSLKAIHNRRGLSVRTCLDVFAIT